MTIAAVHHRVMESELGIPPGIGAIVLAKTALLVDFDNVFISLWELDREVAFRFASDPSDWLQVFANTHLVGEPRKWLVARCYLNPNGFVSAAENRSDRIHFSRFRPSFVRAGFEVIDCPAVTRQGKNAADIRMVLDILDLLNHRTKFDEFVIASGDADFTPVLQRIRAEDRQITIVSPSYLAPAYTSIADRIVDFESMASILYGVEEESVLDQVEASSDQLQPTDPQSDDRARFASFIKHRYAEASGPLNLAALASESARLCPTAKLSEWFGRKTFSSAVSSLNLPHLRTSNHHLWDDERHQPPVTTSPTQAIDIPESISVFSRAVDLPRIAKKDWQALFHTLHNYASKHRFNFTEATRWTRDTMAEEHGVTVARGSVSYVLRGCQFGGARLDGEVPPTAEQIGNALFTALLDQAESLGIQITPDTEEAISAWLGLTDRQR